MKLTINGFHRQHSKKTIRQKGNGTSKLTPQQLRKALAAAGPTAEAWPGGWF